MAENVAKLKQSIEKMKAKELWSVLNKPEDYEPLFIKMVGSRLMDIYIPSDEDSIIRILQELGCPIEIEDEIINFEYNNESFFIIIEKDTHFINLFKSDMLTESLGDYDRVTRLKRAVNSVNLRCDVTLKYIVDEYNGVISVLGGANFLFGSYIPNRKDFLTLMLDCFFEAQKCLKEEMIESQNNVGSGEVMN